MDVLTIKLNKRTMEQLERQIRKQTTEMENCLNSLDDVTCYELIRTDDELIWIRFNHDKDEIEVIREEQS